jgi:hypothetical protein
VYSIVNRVNSRSSPEWNTQGALALATGQVPAHPTTFIYVTEPYRTQISRQVQSFMLVPGEVPVWTLADDVKAGRDAADIKLNAAVVEYAATATTTSTAATTTNTTTTNTTAPLGPFPAAPVVDKEGGVDNKHCDPTSTETKVAAPSPSSSLCRRCPGNSTDVVKCEICGHNVHDDRCSCDWGATKACTVCAQANACDACGQIDYTALVPQCGFCPQRTCTDRSCRLQRTGTTVVCHGPKCGSAYAEVLAKEAPAGSNTTRTHLLSLLSTPPPQQRALRPRFTRASLGVRLRERSPAAAGVVDGRGLDGAERGESELKLGEVELGVGELGEGKLGEGGGPKQMEGIGEATVYPRGKSFLSMSRKWVARQQKDFAKVADIADMKSQTELKVGDVFIATGCGEFVFEVVGLGECNANPKQPNKKTFLRAGTGVHNGRRPSPPAY